MGCYGQDGDYGRVAVDECPECGAPVDEDGESLEQCYYSPLLCSLCNDQPCDNSC